MDFGESLLLVHCGGSLQRSDKSAVKAEPDARLLWPTPPSLTHLEVTQAVPVPELA
jgi:hypothetical protein